MSDIFREIDEEVRKDQFRKIWERYGILIVALLIVLVASVGGWRLYVWHQEGQAAKFGAAFESAALLAEQGNTAEAEAAFAKLAVEGTPIYRGLASMREAAVIAHRDPKAALAIYDGLAQDTGLPVTLREAAGLRAGYIAVDFQSLAEMEQRIAPLAEAGRPFRHSARALLALAAWRANDAAAVRRWSETVTADAESPASTRAQIEMLMALTQPQGPG